MESWIKQFLFPMPEVLNEHYEPSIKLAKQQEWQQIHCWLLDRVMSPAKQKQEFLSELCRALSDYVI